MNRIEEIDIIRTIVIVVLVLYHSFAPFTGGWMPIVERGWFIDTYNWFGQLVFAGMLEIFVCISGFLFCYIQCRKPMSFRKMIKNKLIRLYVPCILWGVVFVLVFTPKYDLNTIYGIFNGFAHLWFLPMLLFCFCLEWLFVYWLKIPLWAYIVIALLPLPSLPLRINQTCFYLLFFHFGWMICQRKDVLKNWLSRARNRSLLIISFLVSFIIGRSFINGLDFQLMPIPEKVTYTVAEHGIKLIYSIPVVLLYFWCGFSIKNSVIIELSNRISIYAFGVYIFQEFILRILYYKLSLGEHVPALLTPFIAFAITLVVSICVVRMVRMVPVLSRTI